MRYLYVCTSNRHTSRTAYDMMSEIYLKDEHDSAGVSLSEVEVTKRDFWDGAKHLSKEQLEWADKVFVFEPAHVIYISKMWNKKYDKKVLNLNIPPMFEYGNEQLVEALKVALKEGLNYDIK